MSDPIEFAKKQLPESFQLAEEMLSLSQQVRTMEIQFSFADLTNEDPIHDGKRAGFMAQTFVAKQEEHLRSIRLLVSAGQHRDALLIARTSLEGLAQLLWAHTNQPHGPNQWFWYAAIQDWRQLQKNKAKGHPVDPALEGQAQQLVDQHGPNYYTPKAAQKMSAQKTLPEDPFRRKWTNLDTHSMLELVEGKYLYDSIYRLSSDWLHWSPQSILRSLKESNETVLRYETYSPDAALMALTIGAMSLLQSLEVLNGHLRLDLDTELNRLSTVFERLTHRDETL